MKDLYDEINVTALNCDVIYDYGSINYRNFDLVLMTVDNREARMYINKYCSLWSTPLINGGLDGLVCSVQVIRSPETACYECTFSQTDYDLIRTKYGCYGLMRNAPEGKIPMVITSASIAAGIMTQEAVKQLHGVSPILLGKRVIIDGNNNEFEIISISKRDDCDGHSTIEADEIMNLKFSNKITLSDLKKLISESINITEFQIEHDKSILYKGICPNCENEKEFLKIAGKTRESDLICNICGSILEDPDRSGFLKIDNKTLEEHGIPDNHILTLYLASGETRYLVQESGNRQILKKN
jgi:adenylyltransferase/sulfurtransferase